MSFIYHTFFFDPLYNALTLSFSLLPWADAGMIVIFFTAVVRLALFPLSRQAVITQMRMNEIAPELEKINEKYKSDGEAKARATLALYQREKVNPFSSILLLIIQVPLIFALYRIFLHFFESPRTDLLYSFVHAPAHINTIFLGFIDISGKSLILAILAGVATFFQLKFATQSQPKAAQGDAGFGSNLAQSMQSQMKYFFPLMLTFISYTTSAVIALYFITTGIFTLGQEIAVRRKKA